MTPDWIAFFGLAVVAVITGVMMIASRNTVYSALYLVLNFATIAIFYLLLNAAFIAMVQITVYAGAIMVLFLFVIMLLGVDQVKTADTLPYQGPIAIGLGFALLVLMGYAMTLQTGGMAEALQAVAGGFGSPNEVGALLFNEYLIPFEAVSVLLLVAMVGAILLTGRRRKEMR